MAPLRTVMNSKIHRAIVTEADINYIGSITIDLNLIEAANIGEWEKIEVLNITNGSRLETYVIPAKRGSGKVCINGAAAHLVHPGDLVILVTYKNIEEDKMKEHCPTIIHVNERNEIVEMNDHAR
ncbi:MAG: aspartate 1-decarboxylase [Candidatus Thalassarchaeaceae archaeon]|nr:aspartate 1-decarboxylase [Candidatus Thalassarchaeaceae archaeon]